MYMYKIAFDVMGSDKGLNPAISAAVKFSKKNKDLQIILVGQENEILNSLKKYKYDNEQIIIRNASEVITMDGGLMDIRRKKDSSMVVALEMVQTKEVNAMMTGGNSAAFIGGSHIILKEFEGVQRPGFMPTLPSAKPGKITMLLDAGANLENDANDLLNFAKLSSIYLKSLGIESNPKVGLLNIGEEHHKGTEIEKEAFVLMKENKDINFIGNIEPRDLLSGKADIVVTDGWTGNVTLKTAEGVAKTLLIEIKHQITKGLRIFAALMLKGAFKNIKKKFDYKDHAGAILLGIDGIVFKSHGSSDERCFLATLRMTLEAVKADIVNKMKEMMK